MSRKKFDKGSYRGKWGHKRPSSGPAPARKETSIIAAKQRHGGPNHGGMAPRRGFPSLPM